MSQEQAKAVAASGSLWAGSQPRATRSLWSARGRLGKGGGTSAAVGPATAEESVTDREVARCEEAECRHYSSACSRSSTMKGIVRLASAP
jgi:hypothetical protein